MVISFTMQVKVYSIDQFILNPKLIQRGFVLPQKKNNQDLIKNSIFK